jgi:hypothetical protein
MMLLYQVLILESNTLFQNGNSGEQGELQFLFKLILERFMELKNQRERCGKSGPSSMSAQD